MRITRIPFNDLYLYAQNGINKYNEKITASLEISKPKNHLLVLDGARAIACLLVIIFHVTLLTHNRSLWEPSGNKQLVLAAALNFGQSGVILFFLLSSFLLFLPFAKALLFDEKWPSISRFYMRRLFRIVPGYYAALFLIILFFHPEFLHPIYREKLWELLTFRMSFIVSQQLNGPFWTLAVEFQFYLLLPLLAWVFSLIVRRGNLFWRITKLIGCLLVLLGWGLLSRWWGMTMNDPSVSLLQHILVKLKPYYYSDEGKYFESFAIGMLLALLYVYTQNAPRGELLRKQFQRWSPCMFLIGLIILGYMAIWNEYHFNAEMYGQWQAIYHSIGYSLCICALLYGAAWFKRPFEWPILRWIGLISFSLYMWHYPFLWLFPDGVISPAMGWQGWGNSFKIAILLVWVCFVIFPIALTFYRWVEMPGMRLGEWLIQGIEKWKKERSMDRSDNIAIQDTTPTLEKVKIS